MGVLAIATELAVSYVSIVPSLKGFKGIVNRELGQAEKSAKTTGNAMGQKMGGSFASSLKKVVGPALAIFGAGQIAGFAKQAVGAFSELEDSTAAAGVVFGENMKQIIDQSKTAAKTMGLTQQQVINAANTFGTYGKAAGLSGKDLADFATEQTKLAADMASFKGTSPEQAIEAIGAALRGETEPIRAYGVMLDDASLKAEAMKMGLISTTKDALTPQNKTLAAQALILKQTADAQGDFARTSDSTANVAKTLTATIEDTSAKLGQTLAPAFTGARTAALGAVQGVGGFLDRVLAFQAGLASGAFTPDLVKAIGLDPKLGFGKVVNEGIGAIRAFGAAWTFNDGEITSSGLAGYMEGLAYKLRTFMDTAARVGKEVWASLGPALTQLGPPVLNLIMALSPLGIVLKALAPVLPDLADSATKLAVVVADVLTIAVKTLTPIISGVVSVVADFISGITSTQAGVDGLVAVLVAATAGYAAYKVVTIASTVATNAQTIATKAATIAQRGMNLALKANPIGIVITALAALVAGIVWFFTETETGRQIVTAAWKAIQVGIQFVVNWFRNTAVPWFQNAILLITTAFNIFRDGVAEKFNFIKRLISVAWSEVLKPVFDKFASIVRGIPGAFEKARDGIGKAWSAIQELAKKPVRFVVNTVIGGLVDTFNKISGVNISKPKLPRGFAKGGYASPGWAMVGEEGPELVNFSKPGRVYTADETAQALGASPTGAMPTLNTGFPGVIASVSKNHTYVEDNAPGWFISQAASIISGLSGLKLSMGRTGMPRIQTHLSGAMPANVLGYASNNDAVFNTAHSGMAPRLRKATAIHELLHVLGLGHTNAQSIMNPVLGSNLLPTAYDAREMVRLYGPHKGGAFSGAVDNPFSGLVDTLMTAFKKAFPGAGLFVDAAGGLAKSGIESVLKIVTDIQNGIKNLAGDIWGNISNFFGGGQAAMLHDQGGVLQPGLSTILNRTGKPEAILNSQQWADISKLALSTDGGGRNITINGNVGWDPADLDRQIETRERRQRVVEGVLV